MRRREFIALVSGAALASPRMLRAQLTVPVVGYLDTASAGATAHLMAEFHRG